MEQVTSDDIHQLIQLFQNCTYKDADKKANGVLMKCYTLLCKDYKNVISVRNENGELSSTYPATIMVPQCDDEFTGVHMREMMFKARLARCRCRFPVPVIAFNNNYVCRSATLSGTYEIYGRRVNDLLFSSNSNGDEGATSDNRLPSPLYPYLPCLPSLPISDSSQMCSIVRKCDINLLKYLRVKYICDLMVEKKKVKFYMNMTSSEKVDKESRYNDFNILSLPYPGCEFFKEFRGNNYCGKGVVYDWKQTFNDANFVIPPDPINAQLPVDWTLYKSWDIIELTQNYLKLLLLYIRDSSNSILVHCISGWDRTPLFISLIRLSLWADGKIHTNLSPNEVAFLTIAYDWYLFGHNLSDRVSKGEEVFFFCFYFLQFLTSDEFAVDLLKGLTEQSDLKLNLEKFDDIKFDATSYGSLTSLNSNCSENSTGSESKSEDCNPPNYFLLSRDDLLVNNCKKHSIDDFSETETLTSSESSDLPFFDATADDLPDTPVCRSPNFGISKTTPVAIPTGKILGRKSQTLSRSNSWQYVSETGSLKEGNKIYVSSPESIPSPKGAKKAREGNCDGFPVGNDLKKSPQMDINLPPNGDDLKNSPKIDSNSSSIGNHLKQSPDGCLISSVTEKDVSKCLNEDLLVNRKRTMTRREKLQAVRYVVYNAYSVIVGFNMNSFS